ncbi:MAG: hypothetical protein V1783_10325 [Bacteroidota bacterium]|jgi:hypothetical protein
MQISSRIILSIFTFFLSVSLLAQNEQEVSTKIRPVYIHAFIGITGDKDTGIGITNLSVHFERSFFRLPKSYSNYRLGLGVISAGDDDIAYHLNVALVHLFGKKASHLELNLGLNYLTNYAADNLIIGHEKDFYPDFYAGYRFEKPEGLVFFRAGFSIVTFFNLGLGVKF